MLVEVRISAAVLVDDPWILSVLVVGKSVFTIEEVVEDIDTVIVLEKDTWVAFTLIEGTMTAPVVVDCIWLVSVLVLGNGFSLSVDVVESSGSAVSLAGGC